MKLFAIACANLLDNEIEIYLKRDSHWLLALKQTGLLDDFDTFPDHIEEMKNHFLDYDMLLEIVEVTNA